MKNFIGIDPGNTGAIAVLSEGVTSVFDFEKLNFEKIVLLLKNVYDIFVCIEKAQVMPKIRKKMGNTASEISSEEPAGQGAVGMFRYGVHYGTYLGILITLKIPFQEVHPMTWKKEFGLLKCPKERSIEVAKQLFPQLSDQLTRKKDHGRAEALLIAEWGHRHSGLFSASYSPETHRGPQIQFP